MSRTLFDIIRGPDLGCRPKQSGLFIRNAQFWFTVFQWKTGNSEQIFPLILAFSGEAGGLHFHEP
jgi:hypothetical protein